MKIRFGHIQFLQYLGVERKFISKNLIKHTQEKIRFFLHSHIDNYPFWAIIFMLLFVDSDFDSSL